MRQLFLLFVAVCVSSCTSCSFETKTKNATTDSNIISIIKSDTSIYITLAEKNLGTLYAGETIEGTLEFVNDTGSYITINEIKGSCGCMTIHDSFSAMNSGETKQLKYTINTSGKSGEEYFDIIMTSSNGKYIIELSSNVKTNIN